MIADMAKHVTTIDPFKVVDPQVVIEMLEAAQPRAIREAVLSGDTARLQRIDDAIVLMRALAVKRQAKATAA